MIRSVLALACLAAVATAHPGMSVDDAALTMRQASGATPPSAATPPTQLAIALQGKFGDSRRRAPVRCSNHHTACYCNDCETKYHYSNVATFGDTRRRRRRRPTYYSYSPTYSCRSDRRNGNWGSFGGWGGWSGWSGCNSNGDRWRSSSRYRSCNSPTAHCGGSTCPGTNRSNRSQHSNIKRNGSWGGYGRWGGWGRWSTCNRNGDRWRTRYSYRSCSGASCGGSNSCPGSNRRSNSAHSNIKRNGTWGGWSNWSGFSGWSTCNSNGDRWRHQYRARSCGGASCGGTNSCPGASSLRNTQHSNIKTHASWSGYGGWGNWGSWSACNSNGDRWRTRYSYRSCRGHSCGGSASCSGSNSRSDTSHSNIKRNAAWGGFGNWSSCLSNGYRYRYRACNSPTASCGGATCAGSSASSQNVRVHCAMNGWGGWSACTATCGTGVQHRYRSVGTSASCGGNACPTGAQSQSCNTQACPVDCAVGYWGGFNACSKSCGGGAQRRTRALTQPKYGGKGCPTHYQNRSCGNSNCAVHCTVTAFSGWSGCTKSCGKGAQSRSRAVSTVNRNGGYVCPYLRETRSCNAQACAIDGSTGPWRAWSTCTKSCAGGSMERSRSAVAPTFGGLAHGHTAETRACNTFVCPTNCGVVSFGKWSACTKSCGTGSQKRSRVNAAPKNGGKACPHSAETRNCNAHACPVDCVPRSWQAYSACTESCGTGSQKRKRGAVEPTFGGKACPHYTETRACNTHACPVDCLVGKWSPYASCTKSCGAGVQDRARATIAPKNGGKACPHSAETRGCNSHACPIDCSVATFESWTTCTKSCGTGSQKRKRANVEPKFGGKACPHYTETRACNVAPCPINGGWTAFLAWSTCSKSCDVGSTMRARTCTSPPPQFGGKPCPNHAKETKNCNTHVCNCPTCSFKNGHLVVGHTTEHSLKAATHGPRKVHGDCAKRGPNALPGFCGKSFVIAHRCHYSRASAKCECVCRKPNTGQVRDHHVIRIAARAKESLTVNKGPFHPGPMWKNPAVVLNKN